MNTNLLGWMLSGGSVALPKRVLAYMEILPLSFEELGQLVYILSLEGRVSKNDRLGIEAATHLVSKRLITYNPDTGKVDTQPFFDKITEMCGMVADADASENHNATDPTAALTEMIMLFEKKHGYLLPYKVQQELLQVMLKYTWTAELVYYMYEFYIKNRQRQYSFLFMAQQAYNADVKTIEEFDQFAESLDYEIQKVREVLRLLGKNNNPSVPQRKMYQKWSGEWQFSHAMILKAIDETVGASNPSMAYVDAILAQWHLQGICTPEALAAYKEKQGEQVHKAKRETAVKRAGTKRKNHFVGDEGYRGLSGLEE